MFCCRLFNARVGFSQLWLFFITRVDIPHIFSVVHPCCWSFKNRVCMFVQMLFNRSAHSAGPELRALNWESRDKNTFALEPSNAYFFMLTLWGLGVS